jgi:hypothetical protein
MSNRNESLLAEIIADFKTLRIAYDRVGLLGYSRPGALATKLLGAGDDIYRFMRHFLLVDAVLRNRAAWLASEGDVHRHVAVFGGNNVGKSTVVNILASCSIASTSAEGGHTRHPLAITAQPGPLFGPNSYAFRGYSAVKPEQLSDDQFNTYAVSVRTSPALPETIVLWDTPDCDAVRSSRYIQGVIETVAAADLVIYVTSLDRYAVEHMVEWVLYLHDAGIPIIQCLNRTRKADRELIMRKQREDLFPVAAEQLGLPAPDLRIMPLKYLSGDDARESDLWSPQHTEAAELRNAVLEEVAKLDRKASARAAIGFALRNIDRALAPAWSETRARETWTERSHRELKNFVASYKRGYLESQGTIEPFERLNLRLLELLDPDIPYLNEALRRLRIATRFPSRMIITVGRWVISAARGEKKPQDDPLPPELKVYKEAHQAVLNNLSHLIHAERMKDRHHPFWDVLDDQWQRELEKLHDQFFRDLENHIAETDKAIRAAADDIYRELQDQPMLLNTFKAVKISATAGGVIFSIVSLGHSSLIYDLLEDLVLTPAIAAATQTTAGVAVGVYVDRRRKALVEELGEKAGQLAESVYRKPLLDLADRAMAQIDGGSLGVERALLDRLKINVGKLKAQLSESADAGNDE